jgi:outer membrane protein OmpA-like peptidoglycan-associated protein
MRVVRRPCTVLSILLASLALPVVASAQEIVQKSFATQLFEPSIGLDSFFSVEGPGVEPPNVGRHFGFDVGLMFNYSRKPLSLYYQTKQGAGGTFDIGEAKVVDVIENQMTADVVGAIGLHYKWLHFQAGIDLPVNLVLTGTDLDSNGACIQESGGCGSLSATGMGDLRLQLKLLLFHDLKGFSLAFSPILTFPTGNATMDYGGDPNVGFRPRIVAGYQLGQFMAAANLGYVVRQNSMIFSSMISDQLTYGLGAGYRVHKRVLLLAELFGAAGFGDEAGCGWDPTANGGKGGTTCTDTSSTKIDSHPLEADVGGRFNVMHGLDVTAGVGFGILRAVGSPQVRVLAGVRWAPDFQDTDGDGVTDYKDKCPKELEDKDGFDDGDGCPENDNDNDLIPDLKDKCPNDAEDKDGFQDDDGCPEVDNDGDGIPDLKDSCPFQPETKNGFQDEDGCPDEPDKDGDGVPDSKDKCPNDQEDRDNFEDGDGCPDPDNDSDGVPDKFDDCANEPEDTDGFKDDDGCPDADNDGDGICDPWVAKSGQSAKYAKVCRGSDKCPKEPETYNGIKDDDGCPDRGAANVKIEEGKIVIMKKIFFDTNKATIKAVSNAILGEVAGTLLVHKEIKGVRIEGHTDSQGDPAKNKTLSQKRAEAVRDWLVRKGIDSGRLIAAGYGPDKPIADNKTAKGREQNRRVEFVILEQPGAAAAPGGGASSDKPLQADDEGEALPKPRPKPAPQPKR